jgi:hypothetical protein
MTGRSLQEIEEAVKDLRPLATLTSSRAIKAGGTAMETVLLQLFNWLWRSHAHSLVPGSHSEPFKAGDTQQPGNYRGITLVSICRKMFTNILRKRLETTVCTKRRPRSIEALMR